MIYRIKRLGRVIWYDEVKNMKELWAARLTFDSQLKWAFWFVYAVVFLIVNVISTITHVLYELYLMTFKKIDFDRNMEILEITLELQPMHRDK